MVEISIGGRPLSLRRPAFTLNLEACSDEELATKAGTGSNDHFAAIVKRYSRRIYRAAFSATGDSVLAEDIAQETFIKVHQSLSLYNPALPFRPWIYKIAINTARSSGRKKKSRGEACTLDGLEISDKADRLETSAARIDMIGAIVSLPDNYRQVIVLRGIEELSFADIGDILDIPEATARSRFHRAKQMLLGQI